jgi:uncharacterized protein
MARKLFLIIGVIFVLTIIGIKVSRSNLKNITLPRVTTNIFSSPPPFPFQNLTIPYLRSKEYKSSLGELKKYSDNTTYTSYLTSYTSDGIKINALLTKPNGPTPDGGFPAIVFVHGYIPPTLYKTTERYVDYINYLAKNGFVVLKIDLRGHGESEGIPGGAYYSGDYVVDTLNAYSALQHADFVNPKKIGLWGHSMSGNVTFRSFVVKKDIPALVIWGGAGYTYTDLLTYRLNDQSYRPPIDSSRQSEQRKKLNETYGTFNPAGEFWKQVAPTNYLDGVGGAIQIHHAANDPTVNIEYSRNLNSILNNTSIPHELFEYSSGGHNISGASFSTAMQRTVDFYRIKLSSL